MFAREDWQSANIRRTNYMLCRDERLRRLGVELGIGRLGDHTHSCFENAVGK